LWAEPFPLRRHHRCQTHFRSPDRATQTTPTRNTRLSRTCVLTETRMMSTRVAALFFGSGFLTHPPRWRRRQWSPNLLQAAGVPKPGLLLVTTPWRNQRTPRKTRETRWTPPSPHPGPPRNSTPTPSFVRFRQSKFETACPEKARQTHPRTTATQTPTLRVVSVFPIVRHYFQMHDKPTHLGVLSFQEARRVRGTAVWTRRTGCVSPTPTFVAKQNARQTPPSPRAPRL
jgi:hypothetical protein